MAFILDRAESTAVILFVGMQFIEKIPK